MLSLIPETVLLPVEVVVVLSLVVDAELVVLSVEPFRINKQPSQTTSTVYILHLRLHAYILTSQYMLINACSGCIKDNI